MTTITDTCSACRDTNGMIYNIDGGAWTCPHPDRIEFPEHDPVPVESLYP